ncbi:unnamed protein product [Adineta steineri]|nr:unnamed protein product [Adineta steineri]
MIFGNHFPVLNNVFLPYANGSCTGGIKTWSTSLTSVWIACCNKSMLYLLLDNLPNLEYFTCTPESTNLLLRYPGYLNDAFHALHAVLSHCPKLKSVDCFIKYSGPGCSLQTFHEIKNRYPLFKDYSGDAWKEHDGHRCRIRKG